MSYARKLVHFELAFVESKTPASTKPLTDVSEQIKNLIKTREAPGYASQAATEAFEKWTSEKKALTDFANESKLSISTGQGLLSLEEAQRAGLGPVTTEILKYPREETRLLIELPDQTVLVEVEDRKEGEIASLADSTKKITDNLVLERAKKLAKDKAAEALTKSRAGASLAAIQKELGGKFESKAKVSVNEDNDGILGQEAVKQFIQASSDQGSAPQEVYENDTVAYLLAVKSALRPNREWTKEERQQIQNGLTSQNFQALYRSIIDRAKLKAGIELAPGLGG